MRKKNFYVRFFEKYGLEASSRPFLVQNESSEKEPEEGIALIWKNFESLAKIYLT